MTDVTGKICKLLDQATGEKKIGITTAAKLYNEKAKSLISKYKITRKYLTEPYFLESPEFQHQWSVERTIYEEVKVICPHCIAKEKGIAEFEAEQKRRKLLENNDLQYQKVHKLNANKFHLQNYSLGIFIRFYELRLQI